MTFKKIDRIPINTNPGNSHKKNLKVFIQDFIDSGNKYAELVYEDGEYKSPFSAYMSLYAAVREHDLPVFVYLRNGTVYFENMCK